MRPLPRTCSGSREGLENNDGFMLERTYTVVQGRRQSFSAGFADAQETAKAEKPALWWGTNPALIARALTTLTPPTQTSHFLSTNSSGILATPRGRRYATVVPKKRTSRSMG